MANAFDKARSELPGGGELALEAMSESQRYEIGRSTYDFVRSVMRNSGTSEDHPGKSGADPCGRGCTERLIMLRKAPCITADQSTM